MLLSFLNIRAVVNGRQICPLPDSRPVIISVEENNPRIVITDGYHITGPVKLVYKDADTCFFKVACAINDWQLGAGLAILAISYLGGLYTGILLLKVFSFIPLIYLLLFYYLNRKYFLKLIPVGPRT